VLFISKEVGDIFYMDNVLILEEYILSAIKKKETKK
jgi:hypothetical protein